MAEYLSAHFTLEEMIYSDTAKRFGINNTPDELHKKILKHTCEYLLEKLRALLNEHYKCQVIMSINSGYRCPNLNTKVGGSSTSQHVKGEAADITCFKVVNKVKVKINPLEVYKLIKTWVKQGKLSVDQCIYEVGSAYNIWVHLSHSNAGASRDRKQFLNYKNGKYILDNN